MSDFKLEWESKEFLIKAILSIQTERDYRYIAFLH